MIKKVLKKLRESLVPIIAFAGCSFLIGFFYKYHLPQIKSWALVEIESQSRKYLPIRVWPKNIELTFFPLGIELQNIRLLPHGELKKKMGEASLKRMGVNLSIYSLLTGQPRLENLYIEGSVFKYVFPPKESGGNKSAVNQLPPKQPKKQKLSSKQFIEKMLKEFKEKLKSIDFQQVYSMPLNNLVIKDIDFILKWEESGNAVQIKNFTAKIGNGYKVLRADLDVPLIRFKETGSNPIFDFTVGAQFLLEDRELKLEEFKVQHKESYLSMSGILRGDIMKLDIQKGKLRTKSHFQLEEFRNSLMLYNGSSEFPECFGILETNFLLEYKNGKQANLDFQVSSVGVVFDGYEIGDIIAGGTFDGAKAIFKKLSLKNSAGNIQLDPASVSFSNIPKGEKKIQFKTRVQVKQLQLEKLLEAVKVGKVPLNLTLRGELPCEGQILPKFVVNCEGDIQANQLSVWAPGEDDNFPILDIAQLTASGKVQVTDKQVSYDGKIEMPNSKGESKGVISYSKGFDLSYKASRLDFNDIANLANLKLEGVASLAGHTKGTSGYGTIKMQIAGEELWLSDFLLGSPRFDLGYQSGDLTISKIAGRLGSSRYSGNVIINLIKKQIHLNAKVPYFELNEIKAALNRRFPVPWAVAGTGSADFKVHGPLDVRSLSYDVKSTIFRGKVLGEPFDQFDVHLISRGGHVESKIFEVAKADGLIRLQGRVSKKGILEAVVVGRRIRLEQSENLKKWGLRLAGYLDFTMSMKGPFQGPKVEVFGRGTHLKVGDDYMKDSVVKINASPDSFTGSGQFFGNLVELDFQVPLGKPAPLRFNLKTREWDFTPVFHIFSSAVAKNEFSAKLTSSLKLKSPTGKLKDLFGELDVDHFSLRRDRKYLKNTGQMSLKFKENKFKTRNFSLKGSDGFLSLSHTKAKASQINLALEGKIDLALATLLTPFLEDLSGDLSISVNLGGNFVQPKVYGSAYLQNTQIRLKAFPMPIENIDADILFSDQKIFLNAVKGELGGGPFTGSGVVTFGGLFDIPIDLNIQFQDSTFNIPKGFKTVGRGRISISGNHFPYLLKGDFNIESGKVKKDLNKAVGKETKVKLSRYLPDFLLAKTFQPLILDIDINIESPLPVDLAVEPIRIETPVTGKLNIKGRPDDLRLTGLMSAGESGRVTFRDNVFDIRNAKVEYQNKPPESPEFNVTAEARVQDYDIGLLVRGSPINPKINLVSQPTLKESEIISLLVLGFTSSEASAADGENEDFDPSSGKLFEAINSQLGISKQVKDLTGIDLQISSSYDSSENSNIQKFRMNKQLTKRLGVSAGHSIGVTQKNDLKLEYKLLKGLSIIGLYEREESTGATTSSEDTDGESEIYGLDLEYRFEFR